RPDRFRNRPYCLRRRLDRCEEVGWDRLLAPLAGVRSPQIAPPDCDSSVNEGSIRAPNDSVPGVRQEPNLRTSPGDGRAGNFSGKTVLIRAEFWGHPYA